MWCNTTEKFKIRLIITYRPLYGLGSRNSVRQMWFFVQLCRSWQDFNWHTASRGPSVIAELLVPIWIRRSAQEISSAQRFQYSYRISYLDLPVPNVYSVSLHTYLVYPIKLQTLVNRSRCYLILMANDASVLQWKSAMGCHPLLLGSECGQRELL